MDTDQRLFDIFLDVQRGLPRQGPGDDEATRRALALCAALPPSPTVLDVGCGPGMQTLVLADALSARIAAVDLLPEYLADLHQRCTAAGLGDRVAVVRADMTALPFNTGAFDLIWSEGAAYNMGFAAAVAAWRPLLRPGGYLAVSELVWTRPDPPREVAAFFAEEYPAMTSMASAADAVVDGGYRLLSQFTLPDHAWWTHYYTPLEAKLPALTTAYAGDDVALEVVNRTRSEIAMRRHFGDWYGYAFYVAQKEDAPA